MGSVLFDRANRLSSDLVYDEQSPCSYVRRLLYQALKLWPLAVGHPDRDLISRLGVVTS
jgi:hypothetical protein